MGFMSLKKKASEYVGKLKKEYNANKQFNQKIRAIEKKEAQKYAIVNAKEKQKLLAKQRLENYKKNLKEQSKKSTSLTYDMMGMNYNDKKKKAKKYDMFSGSYI